MKKVDQCHHFSTGRKGQNRNFVRRRKKKDDERDNEVIALIEVMEEMKVHPAQTREEILILSAFYHVDRSVAVRVSFYSIFSDEK